MSEKEKKEIYDGIGFDICVVCYCLLLWVLA